MEFSIGEFFVKEEGDDGGESFDEEVVGYWFVDFFFEEVNGIDKYVLYSYC